LKNSQTRCHFIESPWLSESTRAAGAVRGVGVGLDAGVRVRYPLTEALPHGAAVSIREKIEATRARWNLKAGDARELDLAFRNRLARSLEKMETQDARWLDSVQEQVRFALGIAGPVERGLLPQLARTSPVPYLALFLQTFIDVELELLEKRDPLIQLLSVKTRSLIAEAVREAVAMSPGSPFEVSLSEKAAILYPAGAALLDQEVVDTTLQWLSEFPEALTHFQRALRTYLRDGAAKRRSVLDDLRLALEQLLRKILGNDKSLENQKEALGSWLKDRGLHPTIAAMYHTLIFGQYAPYQNDAVKHDHTSHPEEVEFLIYLTANFMRLLLQAKRAATGGSSTR
jgi:hypothetical protein